MAYTVVYNGIVFIEGSHPDTVPGPEVKCDLSFKIGSQLKSLHDVKNDLAAKAKRHGSNCIVNFTYGQKSRWLAIDDVAYWGKGNLANLTDSEYKKYLT
ncbi:MAG: hypothetical protein FWD78_02570 [Treponema sp.]|nr:hypothetical protein [Treponema sp.]